MAIRLSPKDTKSTLHAIEKYGRSVFPEDPIQYVFVDEALRLSYLKEDQAQSLITVFAFLSLIIALLGLFGLSAFALERRTKETGIRKVNGARPWIFCLCLPGSLRMDTDCLYYCGPGLMVCHAPLAAAFCLPHGDFVVDLPAGFSISILVAG